MNDVPPAKAFVLITDPEGIASLDAAIQTVRVEEEGGEAPRGARDDRTLPHGPGYQHRGRGDGLRARSPHDPVIPVLLRG